MSKSRNNLVKRRATYEKGVLYGIEVGRDNVIQDMTEMECLERFNQHYSPRLFGRESQTDLSVACTQLIDEMGTDELFYIVSHATKKYLTTKKLTIMGEHNEGT